MLGAIVTRARGLVEAGGSLVGFRGLTEEPAYTAERLGDGVEIRHYGERIAAETTVTADEESARRIGFHRLAGYIFGGNHVGAIEQSGGGRGEKIAMTAPVSQDVTPDGQWVIRFYMPSGKSIPSLPTPDDSAVSLVTVPAETVAVRRFSGSTDPRAVAVQSDQLMRTLHDRGWKAISARRVVLRSALDRSGSAPQRSVGDRSTP